jgi:CRISPR-associated endonuclease Cas2
MLVMLAYDVPENFQQDLLRTEFERLGGRRVQYSLYIFEGEPHECERVIRYMRRVAEPIPTGDIRLLPMEKAVWDQQIRVLGPVEASEKSSFPSFILVW